MSTPPSSSSTSSAWSKLRSLRRASDILPQPSISSFIRYGLNMAPIQQNENDDQNTPLDEQPSALVAKMSGTSSSSSSSSPASNHPDASAGATSSEHPVGATTGSPSTTSLASPCVAPNASHGESDTDENDNEQDVEIDCQPTRESSSHLFSDAEPAAVDVDVEISVQDVAAASTAGAGAAASSTSTSSSQDLMPAISESNNPHAASVAPTTGSVNARKKKDDENPFSVRFTPFVDHSSVMPAQYISMVERKTKEGGTIKIGRYSDRREADERATSENLPIVFKSKVVSRSHAEIFVHDGNWYIKDVKSSSGTFLNHIRLSPACQHSEPHLLNDGDMLQLGMDFRGGSEELYKCIKVRVELNKSWHKRANEFNHQALSSLRIAYNSASDKNLQECAICLLPVGPCQALFVSPCSHGWHYKCIRPLVVKTYPHFLCPNCRSVCDLEMDIDGNSEDEPMSETEEIVETVTPDSAALASTGS